MGKALVFCTKTGLKVVSGEHNNLKHGPIKLWGATLTRRQSKREWTVNKWVDKMSNDARNGVPNPGSGGGHAGEGIQ